MKLTFFSDPGHSWLRVPLKTLIDLDLLDQITPFSYINLGSKRAYCYLEEDKDCPTFFNALEENNITLTLSYRAYNNESVIRTYWPFDKTTVNWARQYLIHE
jgi:hypothetical protein